MNKSASIYTAREKNLADTKQCLCWFVELLFLITFACYKVLSPFVQAVSKALFRAHVEGQLKVLFGLLCMIYDYIVSENFFSWLICREK